MQTSGVALYGGSFNPLHIGHLLVARAVAERLRVAKVILIPSANPPHKSGHGDLADATHRLEMVRLAVARDRDFEVSDIEVRRSGPSYTILTVQEFRRELGDDVPLYWIIGGDSLPELATWYQIRRLTELCRIVTAVRPGYEEPDLTALEAVLPPEQIQRLREGVLPTPRIDISATDIRRRVREGRPVRYLVPTEVEEYIRQHRLYEAPPGSYG